MCRQSTASVISSFDELQQQPPAADKRLERATGATEPDPELSLTGEDEMLTPHGSFGSTTQALERFDMAKQRAAAAAARKEAHEKWMRRNEPAALSTADRKHALKMLVVESANFHKRKGSSHLQTTVRGIVENSRPDLLAGIPRYKKGLSPQLADILFSDLATLQQRKGSAVALSSLMELPLWNTSSGIPMNPLKTGRNAGSTKRMATPAPTRRR